MRWLLAGGAACFLSGAFAVLVGKSIALGSRPTPMPPRWLNQESDTEWLDRIRAETRAARELAPVYQFPVQNDVDLDATRRASICVYCDAAFSPADWEIRHSSWAGDDIHEECCMAIGPCSKEGHIE